MVDPMDGNYTGQSPAIFGIRELYAHYLEIYPSSPVLPEIYMLYIM